MSGRRRHTWTGYDPGGFAAVPEAVWERMFALVPRPVDPDMAVADLRIWVSRAVHPTADVSVWPSLTELVERWDWTREQVRTLLKAEHAWYDATLTGERKAKWTKVRAHVFSRAPERNPTGTPREPHGAPPEPHGGDGRTSQTDKETPRANDETPREPHDNPNTRVDPPVHQSTDPDPPPTPSAGAEGDGGGGPAPPVPPSAGPRGDPPARPQSSAHGPFDVAALRRVVGALSQPTLAAVARGDQRTLQELRARFRAERCWPAGARLDDLRDLVRPLAAERLAQPAPDAGWEAMLRDEQRIATLARQLADPYDGVETRRRLLTAAAAGDPAAGALVRRLQAQGTPGPWRLDEVDSPWREALWLDHQLVDLAAAALEDDEQRLVVEQWRDCLLAAVADGEPCAADLAARAAALGVPGLSGEEPLARSQSPPAPAAVRELVQ